MPNSMTHGLLLHPTYSPARACETLRCQWRYWAVTACQASRCPHRWQREEAEDRARRENKDRGAGEHVMVQSVDLHAHPRREG